MSYRANLGAPGKVFSACQYFDNLPGLLMFARSSKAIYVLQSHGERNINLQVDL
jgi:hypothetical protein